jgi:hypothetical protein
MGRVGTRNSVSNLKLCSNLMCTNGIKHERFENKVRAVVLCRFILRS